MKSVNRNLNTEGRPDFEERFGSLTDFGSRNLNFLRPSEFGIWILYALMVALVTLLPCFARAAASDALFIAGVQAYRAADYARAAEALRQSAVWHPAAGTLQNLGNAEWQRHRTGPAILAWEQSRWLDPFNEPARNNLRFARKAAQLEAPELAWYEVVSGWLPVNWWAWITGASVWLAVGAWTVPGILRWRKAGWHQVIAALALMVFLLSVPAHAGVQTRSRIGLVLQPDTPLRLTPTRDAQAVTRLPAGKAARWERERGNYILVRTSPDGVRGWVERDQFGMICPTAR